MGTMKAFVNRNKVRIYSEWAPENRNAPDWIDANHYKVCLRMGNRRMTTFFSMGYGLNGEPKAEDVLNALSLDASGIENARSFDDWCAEYGYDTDSRKAERIFKVCEKQAERLRVFLGADLYQELLWNTEGL